jgi:hypothetical protein
MGQGLSVIEHVLVGVADVQNEIAAGWSPG